MFSKFILLFTIGKYNFLFNNETFNQENLNKVIQDVQLKNLLKNSKGIKTEVGERGLRISGGKTKNCNCKNIIQ